MLGGEVDIVLVSLVVDSGHEVHSIDIPIIPPIPGDLSGLDPVPVDVLVSGLTEKPGQIGVHEILLLLEHAHYSPREAAASLSRGDIALAGFDNSLKIIMASNLDLVRNRGVDTLQGLTALAVKIKSRIVPQVRLRDHHFYSVESVNHEREEGEALGIPR